MTHINKNKKSNSILVIVPAYNESQNIVNVIESLKKENSDWDIIVINDSSIDNTGELAESTGKAFVCFIIQPKTGTSKSCFFAIK